MKIAIIGGSGRMGRWFANVLMQEGKEVVITGRNQRKLRKAGQQLGVAIAANVEAVEDADVILLSVPINDFEEAVREIGPYTHSGQLVFDISSVKVSPVESMHSYIKAGSVLGTHPVFGPGARGIAHQNFVLTPTSDDERALADKVRSYLEPKGARVTVMTPKEHDQMMAVVLGLSHFISIVSADTLARFDKLPVMRTVGGSTYKVLLTLVESVMSEDPALYASLQMSFPDMVRIEELFQRSSATWAELVRNKDRQGFARKMTVLKTRLEESNPDFGQAYEKMYKLVDEL